MRHDSVTKRDAYARAGIPHDWQVDNRPGKERFLALRLAAEGTYETYAESAE